MVSLFAKFGAAHLIQTFTQRQRKISLKNSRKNESGNGMSLTEKFSKPLKAYISKPKKKLNFKIVSKKKKHQATNFVQTQS